MDSEQTTVSCIETGINFRNQEIQKIILMSVELEGTPEDLEKVRAWLNNHDGITTVTLFKFTDDHRNGISNCMISFDGVIKQIPIHEVIKKLIKRKADEVEKDKISTDYLRGLVKDAESKVELEHVYRTWKQARTYSVKRLRDIADEMSKDRKNSNIAKIAGSAVYIVGAISAVGATALLTSEVVLAGVIAGFAVGATGAATNVGASFIADQLAKGAKATAERILKDDKENTDNFIHLLERHREQTQNHLQAAYMIDDVVLRFRKLKEGRVKVTIEIGDSVEEEVGYLKSAKTGIGTSVEEDGGYAKYVKTVGLADDVSDSLRKLSIGVSIAVSAAVIAVDIYNIVRTAMEMSDGSPDKAAEMIRKAARDLENVVIPKLPDCIVEATVGAALASETQIIDIS